jgi:cathepsin B
MTILASSAYPQTRILSMALFTANANCFALRDDVILQLNRLSPRAFNHYVQEFESYVNTVLFEAAELDQDDPHQILEHLKTKLHHYMMYHNPLVITRSFAEYLNNRSNGTWEADIESPFIGMTYDDLLAIRDNDMLRIPENLSAFEGQSLNGPVPESFDLRNQYRSCILAPYAQKECFGCWSFASTRVLSERLCIATKGKTNVRLSMQYPISCMSNGGGCQATYVVDAFKFLETDGTLTYNCYPYKSEKGVAPPCSTFTKCEDRSEPKKFYFEVDSTKLIMYPEFAKQAIVEQGTVLGKVLGYQDFLVYKKGIYQHVMGANTGGHAVNFIGWGVEKGVEYWIGTNSWGERWGEKGFFRIKRKEAGCEEFWLGAKPKIQ